MKPKGSRKKEIKITVEINGDQKDNLNKWTNSWFFKKINKIGESLLDSPTKKRETHRTQMNKIRNKRRVITTVATEKTE